jgi:hypothetical protein
VTRRRWPRFKLVLQWPCSDLAGYDAMIELETALESVLVGGAFLDGHDAGSGEMNIFIHTDRPEETLAAIRQSGLLVGWAASYKAAYRPRLEEGWTILHPPGLESFGVIPDLRALCVPSFAAFA